MVFLWFSYFLMGFSSAFGIRHRSQEDPAELLAADPERGPYTLSQDEVVAPHRLKEVNEFYENLNI